MSEFKPDPETPAAPLPPWLQALRTGEHTLVIAVLAAMVIIPLAEVFLRKNFNTGIAGSTSFVQHFTLLIGVLGGAMAARDGRLLSLSTLPNILKPRLRAASLIFSSGAAVAVSVVLAWGGWEFVKTETAGKILAYGIPQRAFQLFLPAGFGLVALRLWWRSSPGWLGRAVTLLLTAVIVWLLLRTPFPPERLVWPGLIALLVATVLGAPIFTTLGGAAMILMVGQGTQLSLIPLEHYYLVTDPVLPSIPLFTLCGYFLAEGGASRRLVRLFQALFGSLQGGPAVATTLVCAFFTSFTGASGVTILALGGLLMPVLLHAKYSERNALGLLTSSGSLGLLFPPCLPLILYAVIAQRTLANLEYPEGVTAPELTINQMFLGGLGPGALLVLLTAAWGVSVGTREKSDRPAFRWGEARAALWDAKWELALPVLTMGALFGGLATPVEAAALAALYAFFTQVVVHRDLRLVRDVPRVMVECALLIGGVLLILGVAMGLTKYFVLADVPTRGAEWIRQSVHSPWVFLLLLNLFLLVVGCLMDIYSAIVVVVPIIVPMGLAFGIDPVHLGIVFLANLELGFLTPPVGMNLFLASYRFNKPMSEVTRSILPMLGVLLIGVLLITYVPALTTWLPRWIKRNAVGPTPPQTALVLQPEPRSR